MNKLYLSPFLFMCISLTAQTEPDSLSALNPELNLDAIKKKMKLLDLKGIFPEDCCWTHIFPNNSTIDNMPLYKPPANFKFNMPIYKPPKNLKFNMPIITVPEPEKRIP